MDKKKLDDVKDVKTDNYNSIEVLTYGKLYYRDELEYGSHLYFFKEEDKPYPLWPINNEVLITRDGRQITIKDSIIVNIKNIEK